MGRGDGYSGTYSAVFLYMQPHGLWELHGLPGTKLQLTFEN